MKSLFEAYKEMSQKKVSEAEVCPKCKKSPCECSVEEELKGDQHKLDKNKNGKLDSDDFKKLRKEEQEPPFDKPYTVTKNKKDNGAQKARALAQKALKTAIMQGNERYTSSPDKLKKQHFGMSEDFTEAEVDDMINEVLSKDAKAGDWISDFMKSDAPQFKGKSKQKLKQMALAAYYAKQRNEEVELTEAHEEIKVHSKDGKHIGTITHGKYQSVAYAHPTTKFGGSKEPHPDEDSMSLSGPHETQKGIDFIHAHHRMMSEEVEQLQELSPKTYGSYIKKAKASAIGSSQVMGMGSSMTGKKTQDKAERTVQKRASGINKAVDRLTKEEVEQIEEISKSTLGSYVKKASSDSTISRKIATDFEHRAKRSKSQDMKDANTRISNDYKDKSWKRQDNINKAVDRLTKEEVQIDEANHRDFASQGKMHPDMAKHMEVGREMDFYAHGTGDKMSGKVVKKTDKEVHIKTTLNPYKEKDSSVHKFTIASKLDESSQNVKPTVKTSKYSWGTMKTVHHGNQFSIPLHPEHHEAIAKLQDGQEHHFKTEDGKHWGAYRRGSDVHFQSADTHGANKTTVSHASMREEKEENMITFKDFITEMEFVNGRYVHKGKYGTSYDDPAGKDDEKAEKPAAEKAVKRGRGRPAGSKSGARQFGAASKDGSGADYTGYKLHLPNSNK